MGRRSRKRVESSRPSAQRSPDAPREGRPPPGTPSRAARDAATASGAASGPRSQAAGGRAGGRAGASRRATDERPPPPWGSFPLSEIVFLIAIVFAVLGFVVRGPRGRTMLLAALALGALAALEVSIREHLSGFRSHSTLLAGSLATGVMMALAFAIGPQALPVIVAAGVVVFFVALFGLREVFKRRSGGLGFRVR